MNKLKKTIKLSALVPEFLSALNGVLKLTDRELGLMVELIKLDVNYIKLPRMNKNIVNTVNRKYLMQELKLPKDRLSRYIKSFKERGLLITGPAEDEVRVNPAIVPLIIGDRVQITLILKVEDDRNDNKTK